MLRNLIFSAFLGLFIFFPCFFPAFSDIVRLRNGRTMEGIVAKETGDKIVLDVGVGTVTISQNEIENIERNPGSGTKVLKQKWRSKYYAHSEFAPERFRDIAAKFNDLERLRNTALKNKARSLTRKKKKDECSRKIEEYYRQYLDLNKRLAGSDPKTQQEIRSHNEMVARSNALVAELKLLEQEQVKLSSEMPAANSSFSLYRSAFNELNRLLDKRIADLSGEFTAEEKLFVARISEDLSSQGEKFAAKKIPLQPRGKVMLVSALINGSVPARFILDTGASAVLLSQELAAKLGVRKKESDSFFSVIANGEKVKAYRTVLDSVDVSGMKAEQVPAAVLEKSLPGYDDGLLGMSFLSRFIFQVDAEANTLFLEKFTP